MNSRLKTIAQQAAIGAATGALVIGGIWCTTEPANAATSHTSAKVTHTPYGVPLERSGRVKFSGTAAKTVSLPGIVKKAKDDAKFHKTTAGFEQDITGCYVAYPGTSKTSKYRLSDCVNYTIKFHKMYR